MSDRNQTAAQPKGSTRKGKAPVRANSKGKGKALVAVSECGCQTSPSAFRS